MEVVVIDGQGGGLGMQIVQAIKKRYPELSITAIGTNSSASSAMLKAGADYSATGENPVVVAARKADVIIGPIGIVIADAMLGEVTPRMALAVSGSSAKRLLIPVNLCDNIVVGVSDYSISRLLDSLIAELGRIIS